MAKKAQKPVEAAGTRPAPNRWQWLAKPWAVLVAVSAAAGAALLNINPILVNVRQLPSELQKTSNQFSSWYYQDTAWNGRWVNDPEGYVDAEDMKLSADRMAVDLQVENGVIDGTIATSQICNVIPFFDFLLVRGRVNATRTSASVVVWDIFEGHKRDVAALDLKRDGTVMTVVPKAGVIRLFPAQTRIALDPNGTKPEADFCVGKQEAIGKMVGQILKERGVSATR